MAASVIRELIDAGVHFGHRVSRWNPKMKPYILTKRNAIHIIDPKETVKGLLAAKKFVNQLVAGGKDLLLVGTKRQARKAVEDGARGCNMHFVNDRWLGGCLTNFRTIRSRLARLEMLEQLETDGLLAQRSKKERARLLRETRKIKRNLDGIRRMDRLPGAVFVVDAHREVNALREAKKLGIPTLALIDTDSDPDLVDIPIPGNDDAMRAIELIVGQLCEAATAGKAALPDKGEAPEASTPRPEEPPAQEPAPVPAAEPIAPPAEGQT